MRIRNRKRLVFSLLIACCILPSLLTAQTRDAWKIIVTPDSDGWVYECGKKASFIVHGFHYGTPLDNFEMNYEIRPEKMEPVKTGTVTLKNGHAEIKGVTMDKPGFLRCWVRTEVDGQKVEDMGTAAFEPEKIQPIASEPDDFTEFWDKAIADNEAIPFESEMTLLPDKCTPKVDVYHVWIRNYNYRGRVYGILCVPKGEGPFPALLNVPGAGIRPYNGDIGVAEKGIITLQIGIHGVPVTYEQELYDSLWAPLDRYWETNLDNRDRYYYKRVYLGCVRAVDFIYSLPQYDGENIAVTGGSQGGALSFVTAALDKRIKWLGAYCPALCDLQGYIEGRAGGWPHMFNDSNAYFSRKPEKIETSRYYDVVNFARHVSVPGYYSWGFNDITCPPTSMYAAFNVLSAPKELFLVHDARHWIYPEQREKVQGWLIDQLLGTGR